MPPTQFCWRQEPAEHRSPRWQSRSSVQVSTQAPNLHSVFSPQSSSVPQPPVHRPPGNGRAGLSTTGELRTVRSLGTLARRSGGPIWPLSRRFCRNAHDLRRTFLAGEVFIVVFAYKAVTAEAVIAEYAVGICIAFCCAIDWGEPLIRATAACRSVTNVHVGGVRFIGFVTWIRRIRSITLIAWVTDIGRIAVVSRRGLAIEGDT